MLLSCHLGVNNNNPFFGIFFILIFSLLVPDYRNYVILVIQFLIVQIGSPKYSNYYNQYFCHYVVQFFTQCQINDTLVIKKKKSRVPKLGDQMMDHNQDLQLSELIARTGMYSTTKWHESIGFWWNLYD